MKNRMATMLGALGLSFDTADAGGGGGAAVAESLAGSAGAGGGGSAGATGDAGGGSAASGGTGFFKGLPTSTVQKKAPAVAETRTATTETVADDKTVVATDKAVESVLSTEKTGSTTDAEALARPLMGRYKTHTEAETAMRRSQDEGLRLHNENKTLRETHQKEITAREAKLAAIEAELKVARETPGFQELTKEQFDALAKENPGQAIEYAAQKSERARVAAAAKERAERETYERQDRLQKTNQEIERLDIAMRQDTKGFPKFEEMNPLMDRALKVTADEGGKSPLQGKVWANEFLYLVALGHTYRSLLAKGDVVTADAAKTAEAKATADATATKSGTGDGGGTGSATGAKDPDKTWREAVLGSAPKPFFRKQ